MSTVTDLCTHECTFDCIRFWLHILQMSCKHIYYKYPLRNPKTFYTIPPFFSTSPSFLPLNCGSFPRISTELQQMPCGTIRLRQRSSACFRTLTQCKCLVLNTTPAPLKHQHQCAVSFVSRRTTAEKTLPRSHSAFAAQLCTGGIVGQEAEETRRWEKEKERGKCEEDRMTLHLLI